MVRTAALSAAPLFSSFAIKIARAESNGVAEVDVDGVTLSNAGFLEH
jgi:hypothetical protein